MIHLSNEIWTNWKITAEETFELQISESQLLLFKQYFENILDWNNKFNLISFKTPEEILWRHFTDSVSAAKIIRTNPRLQSGPSSLKNEHCPKLLDLGSGAGLPGIPLKILYPQLNVSFVESITKKCSFLTTVTEQLGFRNTLVLNERAETLGQNSEHREKYDYVVSRAFCSLPPNIELGLPFLQTEGTLILFKTKEQSDEIKSSETINKNINLLGGKLNNIFCYTISHQVFCLVVINKSGKTPDRYPRRTGVPEKKPLFNIF